MKYYELDKEEQAILGSFDKGEWERIANTKKEITRYHSYARGSLNRTRQINVRLSHRDLQKLKAKAAERGIPYQTLITSILHRYGSQ